MKYSLFVLVLLGAITVEAQQKQSLKDLLYSGKLKRDSSGVIRSTDDLSSKIDTTTKKPVDTVMLKLQAVSDQNKNTTIATNTTSNDTTNILIDTTKIVSPVSTTGSKPAGVPKTNTRVWKEYSDSLVKTLKEEALKSKQIKKNTYFVLVEYEIAPDGLVNVINVTSSPENAFLQAQVKQIMDSSPFYLNPVTENANTTRKIRRKQQIIITKD
jgi:uncharacterized protein YydD (DUF2326 family)